MRPLVVVPTYNESENIERFVRRVRECLPNAGILVVDDGSPDGTAGLVTAMAGQLPDVHLLARSEKSGLGSAYRAGFAWGLERGYDAFVEIDADFSHDPAALPTLLAPLEEGFDVAIGSRYVPGGSIPKWAWYRHLLSGAATSTPRRCSDWAWPTRRRDTGPTRRRSCAASTSAGSGPRATGSRSR